MLIWTDCVNEDYVMYCANCMDLIGSVCKITIYGCMPIGGS